MIVILPAVGDGASAAILNPLLIVGKGAAAGLAQGIKGAIAKEAVEIIPGYPGMTGEIFALSILKKAVIVFGIRHRAISLTQG